MAVERSGAEVIFIGVSAILAERLGCPGARFSRIKSGAHLQSALEEAKHLLSAESSLTALWLTTPPPPWSDSVWYP